MMAEKEKLIEYADGNKKGVKFEKVKIKYLPKHVRVFVERGHFKYTKWEEYFRLQPRDYFGGRVLFSHQIENRDEKSDNEAGLYIC